jgi:xanthine dehydrogenase accessory factor
MSPRFDFFGQTHELVKRGEPFATATVVRAEKPTSGKPGDKAIITLDGELHGWIGGSCARPTVITEALAALRDDHSRLIRLSAEPPDQTEREGLTDLSMTCFSGGTMEIYIEPHQPQPKLLIVGDRPVADALAGLGKLIGYRVVRVATSAGSQSAADTDEWLADPQKIGEAVTPVTFIVVATHGEHDEVALEEALRARAPYVGLVASSKRADSIRAYLGVRGISKKALAALRAPAGLDIQARRPEEIALSILAEIVQTRRNLATLDWEAPTEARDEKSTSEEPSATAIDPVCGMSVQIANAQHFHEHEGSTYYFCCAGCLTRFAEDPDKFLD